MSFEIANDDREFLQSAIQRGQFPSEADALHQAIGLLRRREKYRQQVQVGIDQLDRGEGIIVEPNRLANFFDELVDEADRELEAK